jgi:hypothetical protein
VPILTTHTRSRVGDAVKKSTNTVKKWGKAVTGKIRGGKKGNTAAPVADSAAGYEQAATTDEVYPRDLDSELEVRGLSVSYSCPECRTDLGYGSWNMDIDELD